MFLEWKQVWAHAKDIMDLKSKMHQLYADSTGTPLERFVELMDRERWVSPGEALEIGLVSKIITRRLELEALLKGKDKLSSLTHNM